jgi:MoxR-like ATPase
MKTAIIKAALFTKMRRGYGIPLILVADPGVGKSDVTEDVCRDFDLPCEVLSPAERGEGAFGVVMVPDGKGAGMVLRSPRPDWTTKFDATGRGVVFIDEASCTPPALQPPLLGLFRRGVIGAWQMQPGVRRLAAMNPTETATGGYDLGAAVGNRVIFVRWSPPTVAEHTAYMFNLLNGQEASKGRFDAEAEEARVDALWPDAIGRAVGLETAFLARFPALKNVMPKPGDPAASGPWPSDRSWENATRALASADVHKLSAVEREEFVAGAIGEAVASQLFGWIEQQDMPNPADVLDGKVGFVHASSRLDRTAALLNGCAAVVTPKDAPKRAPRVEALWELLAKIAEQRADQDVLVPAAQAAVMTRIGTTSAAARKVLAPMNHILEAAGFTDATGI